MATHDYVIDNSTGANVRADINNVLQAILTNNSSSSAPSTTAAYMFWADTTSGTLKIRNSSDNAWVELLQLDGTITLEDGSASTPGLAFRDDLNTGIFSSAADTFNVATAGVERMELGATTIFNESGADVDFRIEGDTNANLFYVNAGNNRVGIGTSSPNSLLDVSALGASDEPTFKVSSENSTIFLRTAGSSGSFPTGGGGNDGELLYFGGDFRVGIGTASKNLIFFNGSAYQERMRLDSSGRLLLGTTTKGFDEGDDLTIATSTHTGITIRSGTSSIGNIYFADGTSGDSRYRGIVQYHHSGDSMRLYTAATEAIRIDSSQNIGIGTTSPTSKLNVVGRLDVDGLQNQNTAEIFGNSTSGQSFGLLCNAGATSGDYCANFRDKDAGAIMILRGDGKVGIGTSTPGEKLVVSDTSSVSLIRVIANNAQEAGIDFGDTDDNDIARIRYSNSDNLMKFFVNAAERMRIDSSGRFGLGVSSLGSAFIEARQNSPVAGRLLALGTNGTATTSNASGMSNALVLFRVKIDVPPNTTTDLVSGYGGSLVLITMLNNGGDDVQQTRVRTHAWSTSSSLFFNTYGANQPTVSFSVVSGVLKVNHNHTGNIFFNCAGFIISGPHSG